MEWRKSAILADGVTITETLRKHVQIWVLSTKMNVLFDLDWNWDYEDVQYPLLHVALIIVVTVYNSLFKVINSHWLRAVATAIKVFKRTWNRLPRI